MKLCILQNTKFLFLYLEKDTCVPVQEYIQFFNEHIGNCIKLVDTLEIDYEISDMTFDLFHEKEINCYRDPLVSQENSLESLDFCEIIRNFETIFGQEYSFDKLFLEEEIFLSDNLVLCFDTVGTKCVLLENTDFVSEIVQQSRFIEKIKVYNETDIFEKEKFIQMLNLVVSSLDELSDKLESIEKACDIGTLNKSFMVYQKLKHVIQENYKITKDDKDRIKYTDLLDQLKNLNLDPDKKVLHNIMAELNVNKKRLNNGVYWLRMRRKIIN